VSGDPRHRDKTTPVLDPVLRPGVDRVQAGIRLVAPLSHPDQRAGLLSVLFRISYRGLGIPGVAADLAVVHGGGLEATGYVHGPGLIVLRFFATIDLICIRNRQEGIQQQIERGGIEMNEARPHMTPGPDHPISVEKSNAHVVVQHGAVTIAETNRALELRESSYPSVLYVPIEDVDQNRLHASEEHTWCPYKGEASYYDVLGDGGKDLEAAVWYYDDPFPAVSDIQGHVAFYTDRLTVSATTGESAT
jgi:uncharacterized protein (DUF427 family)